MKRTITYTIPRMHHQKVGERAAFAEYLRCRREGLPFGFGLFFKPGLGKSATAINTLRRIMIYEQRFPRILIVCPPVVVPNWKDEWKKFSKLDPKHIHLLQGTGKKCAKTLREVGFDHQSRKRSGIFAVNYEKIVSCEELYEAVRQWEPEFVILDEIHRIKDSRRKRSRYIEEIVNPLCQKNKPAPPRPGVLGLSGTSILNSPLDLFSQFLALDGGESFGDNYFVFRARYFRDRNAGMPSHRHFPKWVLRSGAEEEIKAIVARKSVSAEVEDCLDLPELIEKKIYVDMSTEQARHYHEMRTQLITYVNDEACVANLALTKALRLMQIASGFIQTEDGSTVFFEDNPKLDALVEILKDVAPNRKVIVWAVFKANYVMIRKACEKLKLKYVEIHGESGDHKERKKAENDFQTKDEVRVLIGNPGAGGIGINLTASAYAIYFSSNFSLEHREQSRARNYRKGSERHGNIVHCDLVCNGTIEDDVLKRLDEKKKIGLQILQSIF